MKEEDGLGGGIPGEEAAGLRAGWNCTRPPIPPDPEKEEK